MKKTNTFVDQKLIDLSLSDEANNLFSDNTVFLHPALDFAGNICILGFRIKKSTNNTVSFQNLFLIFHNETVISQFKNTFQDNDITFVIEDKNKLLPLIDDKWSKVDLNSFIKNPLPSSFSDIFKQIKDTAKRYFYLSEEADFDLITAWIIATYFHRLFFSFPFLHIKAPKGSGKSQLLGVLEKLCFNAEKMRYTLATIGDTITNSRSTLLMDQADSFYHDRQQELVEIITDSYKKDGGKRRVMDMSKGRKMLEFETFSPKAFASTIELPEDLKDRCILIPIIRSTHLFPTPDDQNENWHSLRGSLYKLLLHFPIVTETYNNLRKNYSGDSELHGRNLDLWLPIETIMSLSNLNRDRIDKAKKLYVHRSKFMQYEPKEHEEEIVTLLMDKFADKDIIAVSVKELTTELNQQEKYLIDVDIKFGAKPFDERKVGWAITNFNLSSDKKKTNKGIVYIFEKSKLEVIYKQYFNTYAETA